MPFLMWFGHCPPIYQIILVSVSLISTKYISLPFKLNLKRFRNLDAFYFLLYYCRFCFWHYEFIDALFEEICIALINWNWLMSLILFSFLLKGWCCKPFRLQFNHLCNGNNVCYIICIIRQACILTSFLKFLILSLFIWDRASLSSSNCSETDSIDRVGL